MPVSFEPHGHEYMPMPRSRGPSLRSAPLLRLLIGHLPADAGDADRAVAAELAEPPNKLVASLDLHEHVRVARFFGRDDVAHLKRHQLVDTDCGSRQETTHL